MDGAARNIVLIGFMGTGKSSVGRLLATRLGHRFVDLDRMIVQRAGRPISEIFEQQGEDYFRELESDAVRSLGGNERMIVATGGGIIIRPDNVDALRELGLVVWLTADEAVIYERVSRNSKRPLLRTPDPRATISQMLRERQPLYESAAHCTVETSERSHREVADQVMAEADRFFTA